MPLQCNICHCCCVLIHIILCTLHCVHCILYIVLYTLNEMLVFWGSRLSYGGTLKNYIPALKMSKHRYSILEFNIVELAFISALFIKTILT